MTPEEREMLAQSYAGFDFRRKRFTTIEAFCVYGDAKWKPQDFLDEITEAVNAIPADARNARVDLEGGYDEMTKLRITYEGRESDEEVADRVRDALRYVEEKTCCAERETYERLKAKFES